MLDQTIPTDWWFLLSLPFIMTIVHNVMHSKNMRILRIKLISLLTLIAINTVCISLLYFYQVYPNMITSILDILEGVLIVSVVMCYKNLIESGEKYG